MKLTDLSQLEAKCAGLCVLRQTAVGSKLQHAGFVPEATSCGMNTSPAHYGTIAPAQSSNTLSAHDYVIFGAHHPVRPRGPDLRAGS